MQRLSKVLLKARFFILKIYSMKTLLVHLCSNVCGRNWPLSMRTTGIPIEIKCCCIKLFNILHCLIYTFNCIK